MTLEELFSAVLTTPIEHLTDTASPATVKSWTSMGHIRLIATMEEVYDIRFTTAQIRSIKTLGDARKILQENGISL